MELFSLTFGFLTVWICLNTLWFTIIRNRTGYPGNTQGDTDTGVIVWLTFIFGPLMFLFLKQIRVYRKHRYLKGRIRYYRWTNNPIDLNGFRNGVMQEEIDRMERIYKISKIHQQTRRNNLKKKLLLK